MRDDYKFQYSAFLKLLESALYGDKIHYFKNVQPWLWLILGNVGTGFEIEKQSRIPITLLDSKTNVQNQYSRIRDITFFFISPFLFISFFFLFHELASTLPTKQLEAVHIIHAASSGATEGFTLLCHICSSTPKPRKHTLTWQEWWSYLVSYLKNKKKS